MISFDWPGVLVLLIPVITAFALGYFVCLGANTESPEKRARELIYKRQLKADAYNWRIYRQMELDGLIEVDVDRFCEYRDRYDEEGGYDAEFASSYSWLVGEADEVPAPYDEGAEE